MIRVKKYRGLVLRWLLGALALGISGETSAGGRAATQLPKERSCWSEGKGDRRLALELPEEMVWDRARGCSPASEACRTRCSLSPRGAGGPACRAAPRSWGELQQG